jgi:hypothetical protein
MSLALTFPFILLLRDASIAKVTESVTLGNGIHYIEVHPSFKWCSVKLVRTQLIARRSGLS